MKTNNMKFWEAMKLMEEGKKVRRKTWLENEYIYLDEYNIIMDEKDEPLETMHYIGQNDWEIYEPKKRSKRKIKRDIQNIK